MKRLFVVMMLLLSASTAQGASPLWGSFEFRLSGYLPDIDSEFGGSGQRPFTDAFGDKRSLMFRVEAAKSIFTEYGSLDAGLGLGYWGKSGKAFVRGGNTPSADETSLKMMPLSVSLTYRLDMWVKEPGIPLVPYARISLLRYHWWATNGSGDVSGSGGSRGSGATNGYSFTGGVAFLLDFVDPQTGRDLDNNTGINNTYIFVDVTKAYVKDFGSSKSWDLSDANPYWTGGLLFVF